MLRLAYARSRPVDRFDHLVICVLAISLCITLNGCFVRPVLQVNRLQVPMALSSVRDGQETSSQEPSNKNTSSQNPPSQNSSNQNTSNQKPLNQNPSIIVHQVALGRLISFNKRGVLLETRDMLSALPAHATTHSFPDVRVVVPHITEDLVRGLLGIADSRHEKQTSEPQRAISGMQTSERQNTNSQTQTLEPQSLNSGKWRGTDTSADDAGQLIFSDNYESVLDLRPLLRELTTGHIQPNADALDAYLISEQVTARTLSVLLPAHTSEEVARRIVCYSSADCRISVQAVNDRWQLTSSLPSPRPIVAGLLALRVHHSNRAHFVPGNQTSVHMAMNLGWIESLPTPTDFWNSSPPKPRISLSQAQSLLTNSLTSGGLDPAVSFAVPNGYAILTPMELLAGEESAQPDYARRFKIESHSVLRFLCKPWNCSTGAVREMVLLVGADPPYPGVSPVVPLNTQIQAAIRGSLREIDLDRQIGSTCYAFVYVYDHRWDGTFRLYDLPDHGIRAKQHLESTNLSDFLKCQQ
jgi:hypothetical protein